MNILYDSKDHRYKTPFGCMAEQEQCQMRISVPMTVEAMSAFVIFEDDQGNVLHESALPQRQPQYPYDHFHGQFSLTQTGLYYYYFKITTKQNSFFVYKQGTDETSLDSMNKWQLTCTQKDFTTPEAFCGSVMYQIFPDRFYHEQLCDTTGKLQPFWMHEQRTELPYFQQNEQGVVVNNDFFGGNLKGITRKLPYLGDLGVEVLYLNPIFKAFSNHRYDTCDYKQIDPLLGTEQDFINLCEQAHGLGIKIILDIALSHTGARSVYFDKDNEFGGGAYHNQDSPYRSWYQMDPQNPNGYTSWWGIDTLPCTNEMDESFVASIVSNPDSVIAHWLKLGADGYRLDVADELPSAFLRALRKKVKEIAPEAILIGEVWEDASNKISYGTRRQYFLGKELDSVMNYPFREGILGFVLQHLNGMQFANIVMEIAENYPKQVLHCVMNSLSTHDTIRALTQLGTTHHAENKAQRALFRLSNQAKELAMQRMKLAVFLQFTLPGSACIYYGDEIGMQGFEDPFNRGYFTWWDIEQPLHSFHQAMAKQKRTHKALQVGDIRLVTARDGTVIFRRQTKEQKLLLVVSTQKDYDCFVKEGKVLLHNGALTEGHLVLPTYGFALLSE